MKSLSCPRYLLLAILAFVTGSASASASPGPGLSAASLFNAGNAALKEGRFGEAILNYERASWMAPRDPDIEASLRLARSKAGLWNGERTLPDRLVHRISLSDWAAALAAAVFLVIVTLPLGLLVPRARPLWVAIRTISVITGITSAAAIGFAWTDVQRAVVTAREAVTRVAPAPASGTAFHLREGEVVRLTRAHGDFCLVENRDGRAGWAKASDITPVLPR